MLSDSPVVSTPKGLLIRPGSEEIAALRDEFRKRNVLRLRQFLSAELFDRVAREIERGIFSPREDEGIAAELCLEPSRAHGILDFVMNSPDLFHFVRSVTGCESIGGFAGRIYRMEQRDDHYDSWHDDTGGGKGSRLIGFSLNLSRLPYRGGVFQIRAKEDPETITEVANTGPGDAFLFRIATHLQHRVTSVTSPESKTAYAGWFLAGVFDRRRLFQPPEPDPD